MHRQFSLCSFPYSLYIVPVRIEEQRGEKNRDERRDKSLAVQQKHKQNIDNRQRRNGDKRRQRYDASQDKQQYKNNQKTPQ